MGYYGYIIRSHTERAISISRESIIVTSSLCLSLILGHIMCVIPHIPSPCRNAYTLVIIIVLF